MKKNSWQVLFIVALGMILPGQQLAKAQQDEFSQYCSSNYSQKGECPSGICQIKCEETKEGQPCENKCIPKTCPEIDAKQCPEKYCAVMTDCSQKKICNYKMQGGAPKCGDISYAGQDVECCPGLVRRCGNEFLDGTCDMEGKDSVYNLPICIPCGNGICNQFENRCNCPEDCGKPPDIPLIPGL